MRRYEIKIDINRLLHYSVPSRYQMDNETLLMMIKNFSSYIKKVYINMIEESIQSQRYKGEWEPFNEEGYLEYIRTTPSTPIVDLIYDALEVRSIKKDIIIRFNPHYKYPGSARTLISVLNAIEFGTSKFNARPLLKKVTRELNASIPVIWRAYIRKKGAL